MNTVDVTIVGAGPVGLVLAHHLGRTGISVMVIEAADALSDEPRAVGLDPESLRSLQGLGLLDALAPDILFGVSGDYVNAAGDVLFALDHSKPGPLGYQNLCSFSQPAFVRSVADQLDQHASVKLQFQTTLTSLVQDDQVVVATVSDHHGDESTIRSRFLVGCDGGRSTVRNLLGIKMQGESNPLPWLVIDTVEPPPDTCDFRFFCDPDRPGMYLRTPHNNRRWEWMLLPGEDREKFLEDETIADLLRPHVDPDTIDIYRRRVYDFHAILADRFSAGRVFLAGDAAHMTPPFAGQGLNSGLRDAANLGWKLAMVCAHGAPLSLLDTYETERKPHAQQLIDIALLLGEQIQPIDHAKAAERDAVFASMNAGPPEAKAAFLDGISNALIDRQFSEGAALDIDNHHATGRMLLQPEVHENVRLDDLLGPGFSLVGFNCDPADVIPADSLAPWLAIETNLVRLDEPDLRTEHGETFLASLQVQSGEVMLVRPDRFCMAVMKADTAAESLERAAQMLAVNPSQTRGAVGW